MIRGTTPTLKFGIPFASALVEVLYVTFNQDGQTILEKDINSVQLTNKEITAMLTQADTLKFKEDEIVEMQVRIRTTDGGSFASNIIKINAGRILKDGQI